MYNRINILVLTKFPLIALSLFFSFIVIGIIKYPGSTYLDNSTIGYDFFKNFLSDLGRTLTFNGNTNFYSSFFFNNALCIAGFLFSVFYYFLPKFFQQENFFKISIIGSTFGILSCLCFIGTGLTPADLHLDAHIFFSNYLFYLSFPATLIYSYVIIRSRKLNTIYGIGYFAFAISLVSYIFILEFGPDPSESNFSLIIQATSQKIITICFVLATWMLSKGINKSINNAIE